MPKPLNKVVKSISPKSAFDDMSKLIDTTITINQGDLCVLDTTNHLIKAVTGAGETGANFLGMSRVSIASGVPLSPIQGTDVDGKEGIPGLAGPVYGVTAKVIIKTGDAVNPGDKVYLDAGTGARNVTTTQGGGGKVPVGIYQGAAIGSAAAGQEIECLLGCQYPNDVLSF